MAFGSSVLTHKKEQQIKIAGEFKPTVDCLCAIRRGFVAVYIEKVRSAECTLKYYAELNLNQSGQYGQIYAEKFTSVSLICKVFYGKMKAQWGKYTLLLNLL